MLINIAGDDVTWSPRSNQWLDRSADVLVNVPTAARVTIPAVDTVRSNLLVGSPDSAVAVDAAAYRGQLLALGDVTLNGTRITGAGLTAGHLPSCTADRLSGERRDPAATIDLKAPVTESTLALEGPVVDQVLTRAAADTTLLNAPAAPSDRPGAVPESTTSSTTTTSTTTTTSAPIAGVADADSAMRRPVPGAAFALGGAATSSNWWIGLPVALLGGALLAMSWLGAGPIRRPGWMAPSALIDRIKRLH